MMKKSSSSGCGCAAHSQAVDADRATAHKEVLAAFSDHESRILEALEAAENEGRFLVDPLGMLASLGIPVPSSIAHRLRRTASARIASILPPAEVRLPNGQRIAPRVRVRFTRTETGG